MMMVMKCLYNKVCVPYIIRCGNLPDRGIGPNAGTSVYLRKVINSIFGHAPKRYGMLPPTPVETYNC